jgi:hypothetical protein
MPNFRSFGAVSAVLWLFEVEKERKIKVFFIVFELRNIFNGNRY